MSLRGHGASAGLSLLASMQKSRAPAAARDDDEAAPAAETPASRSFEAPVSLQQVAASASPSSEGTGEPGSP
jgi:hypothetical protein